MNIEQHIKEENPYCSTNTDPTMYVFTLKAVGTHKEIKWFEQKIKEMFDTIPNKQL